jgi:hypothetical protein
MIRGDATLAPGARLRMHGLVKGTSSSRPPPGWR